MDIRRGIPVALGVAALGVLAWWLTGSGPDPAPAPQAPPHFAPGPAPQTRPAKAGESAPAPAKGPPEAAADVPAEEALPAPADVVEGSIAYSGSDQGEAAPGILVVLKQGTDGRGAPEFRRTTSGDDGRFRFEGVPPGTWCFSTRTPGSPAWDHVHEVAVLEPGGHAVVNLWVERPVPEGTGVLVRGTLRHADGAVPASFSLTLRNFAGPFLVEGEAGAFERRLPAAGRYAVQEVRIEGVRHPTADLGVEVGADGAVAVVLPKPLGAALLVLDAGTGRPVPGARVHRQVVGESWPHGHHPNRESLVAAPQVAGEDGLVDLGSGAGTEEFFVGAEGRAWRRVEVGFQGTEPVPVLLHPGGRLRLSVARWKDLRDPTIHFEGKEWKDNRELAPAGEDGLAEYEGLPAGPGKVVVRSGPWYSDGMVYAEGAVEIPAGGTADLALEADPGTGAPPAPVTIRVTAPSGWSARKLDIAIEGRDPANASVDLRGSAPLPEAGGAAEWKTSPIPPGRYFVTVSPQSYHAVLVPAGGGVVELALPATVEVRVTVLDIDTGEPVPSAAVSWHGNIPGRTSHTLDSAGRGEAAGECRFRAPAGTVGIWATGKGYENSTNIQIEVVPPGPVLHVARIRRAGDIVVKLVWEGAPPPWNEVEIHLVRGGGSWGGTLDAGRWTCDSLPPGKGMVDVDLPEDQYEPVPDREVEIRAGETTEVEVRIVRKVR